MTCVTPETGNRHTTRHHQRESRALESARQNRYTNPLHTASAGRRHYFAYANVERWMAQGRDVTAMLPYLARYMGHATVESAYYYIHTSPDFMDAYASITDTSQSLLPEVGFE